MLYSEIFPVNLYGKDEDNPLWDYSIPESDLTQIKLSIEKKLAPLIETKESPPQKVPEWVLKKWHRNNPGFEIIILGKTIKIGGGSIRYTETDRVILAYHNLLEATVKCIQEKRVFKIFEIDDQDFAESQFLV